MPVVAYVTSRKTQMAVFTLAVAIVAFSLACAGAASAGSIVYDDGAYVHYMNDNGSGGGLIGAGREPHVNPEGNTVVFATAEFGLGCNYSVSKWQVGTPRGRPYLWRTTSAAQTARGRCRWALSVRRPDLRGV